MTFIKKLIATCTLTVLLPVANAASLEIATPVNTAQLTNVAHVEISTDLMKINEQLDMLAKQVFQLDTENASLTQQPALIAELADDTISLTAE